MAKGAVSSDRMGDAILRLKEGCSALDGFLDMLSQLQRGASLDPERTYDLLAPAVQRVKEANEGLSPH